ncbi:MAG: cell division protein SepF [Armatimonadetes bacterium]|nr:cell division protein SepF [Armatimonadota bacterium]
MSALKSVTQAFRNAWGAADDEDEDAPEPSPARESSTPETENPYRARSQSSGSGESPRAERFEERPSDDVSARRSERYERMASRESPFGTDSSYGGSGARRLRSVSMPLRATREKNIYTLKPKSLDESAVAADYLKTGCAVVINLEEVEQGIAIRIIDFMSGVCYGLENQGHAMKLGEKIFLFTPGDFELSSDELDYAENRDLIFKDVVPELAPPPSPAGDAERRSWER